ncbi:MAG: ABC transporter substrate-binding protein, partial [Oscillospiraceae bacterium]
GLEQTLIFESEQYGGEITWISASNDYAYYEKLATLIAADDSPDLMTYEPLAFPYGVSRNMFEPLEDYFDIDDPLWSDMRRIIESYEYNGHYYYFPHRIVTSFALNYNRKTVEQAGMTDPYELYRAGEWTWDAWREMMITFCNQSDDNIGFYGTDTMISSFIHTTGTPIIEMNSDGSIVNNLKHPDITRAVEYFAELGRNGLLYPSDHPHGDWVSPQIWAKLSDKILFLGMEPEWTYIAATEEIQNPKGVDNDIHDTISDFAFVPFPRDVNAGAYYTSTGTFGYMIPKGAKNASGAVEFIYCNRLYETDQAIIDQVRNDHIAPEKITYTSGPNEGKRRWQITWDPEVYDLWRECVDSDAFDYVGERMFGFDEELKTSICTSMYDSTFNDESWTQKSEEIMPIVESVLDKYR